MERLELLNNYRDLNNSFEKKLTFHLGAEAGFFSEFNNMVLAILYCLTHRIKFTLYSKTANFARTRGWTDFFIPFCDESTIFLHKRYNRRAYQMKEARHFPPKVLKFLSGCNYLTQDIWDSFRSEEFNHGKFNIPELNLEDASLLEATREIIKMIWHYNPASEKIVEDFKSSLNMPDNYLGIHIRAGDKLKEADAYSEQHYMAKANKLNSSKTAFVLTDDYRVIENLRNSYKEWKIYTLCSPQEKGYNHSEFKQLDKNQKYLMHLKLFASLDICAASQKFIGTYSSNPGMFMGMRIGEKNCIGVDYESWVLW